MKISRKEHTPGFTPCDEINGKCKNPVHWVVTIEWHVPDILVRTLLERMQSEKFTADDLDRVQKEFCEREGVTTIKAPGEEVVKELMRMVKRRKLIAEVGREDRNKAIAYAWVGLKGGAL